MRLSMNRIKQYRMNNNINVKLKKREGRREGGNIPPDGMLFITGYA